MARTDYEPSPALIKKARILAGLGQIDAGKKLGVSTGLIDNWEAGVVKPNTKSLHKLSQGYGCEVADFYPPLPSSLYDLSENVLETYLTKPTKHVDRQADVAFKIFSMNPHGKMEELEDMSSPMFWRNPEMRGFESDNCLAIKNYEGEKIVAAGPTRTAKTLVCLEKIFYECFKQKIRVLILRSKAEDLKETIRPSIRDLCRYSFDDEMSPIKALGASKFTNLYFPNGSEIVLAGADRESKLLGSEWDIVYYSQVEQSTPEEIQTILTRAAGTAGGLTYTDGTPRPLLICDANPDREDNHIYQMKENGEIDWIEFGFEDNPLYYHKGKRTREWSIVERLDRNLTGIFHDRWFKGLWKSPEGAVFVVDDKNIVDTLPELSNCDIYRGCDWGQTHPSVCLWLAIDRSTQDMTVYREWRKTHSDIDEMGEAIKTFSQDESILATVIDWDENRQKLLRKHANITSQFAYKGPGSVMDGIFLIQAALRRAVEGKSGGLYIHKDLLCNQDPHPNATDYPKDLIAELHGLQFDEKKDAPVNKGDDAVAALRYILLYRAKENDMSIYDYSAVIEREDEVGGWQL